MANRKYRISKEDFDKLMEGTEMMCNNEMMKFKYAVIDFNKSSISDIDSIQITHFDCLPIQDFREMFPDKIEF